MSDKCEWCGTDRYEAAIRYEGPHSTWCVRFRESQRGGSDFDRKQYLIRATQAEKIDLPLGVEFPDPGQPPP